MTTSATKRLPAASVLAIAVLAYVAAKLTHEGLGHGGVCLAVGGKLAGFSTSWCDCDKEGLGAWSQRAIKAGGTLANLVVGCISLALLNRRWAEANLYYFLWLTAAVNLFVGGGYMMTDRLIFGSGIGDWAIFVQGLSPALPWKIGITAIGVAISLGSLILLRRLLDPLLGEGDAAARKRNSRPLTWLPYLVVGGVFMTLAASLNRLGAQFAVTSAMATLGGTAFLPWITAWVRASEASSARPLLVPGSNRGWLVAAVIVAAWTLAQFGPGIMFRP